MRIFNPLVGAFAACLPLAGSIAAGSAGAQGVETPRQGIDGLAGSREYLELFDLDRAVFKQFRDRAPLSDDERDNLLRVLLRVQAMPLTAARHWIHGDVGWSELALSSTQPAADDSADAWPEFRGDLYLVSGTCTLVEPLELTPELRERFQLEHVYRCRIMTSDNTPAIVITAVIPSAWKVGEPIHQVARCQGLFVKRLPPDDSQPQGVVPLLFVAARVAWYPPNLLGKLRMDAGLLDDVRDMRPIDAQDRECFYQLLGAACRSGPGTLERAARAQLDERRLDLAARLEQDRLAPQEMARTRREQERLDRHVDDVVPLFNSAASQRGQLVTLVGHVRRALEVRVSDADIVERLGIHHYYEVEVFTDDSQGNPLVFCLCELPADMPTGDRINEQVRIAGFFLKSWAYRTEQPIGKKAAPGDRPDGEAIAQGRRTQLAPLLIGRDLQWIPAPSFLGQTFVGAFGVGGMVLVCALVTVAMWWLNRGGRRSYRDIVAAGRGGHGGEAGADAPPAGPPDFSQLG